MLVTDVSLRDFRSYHDAQVALTEQLTVVWGPNGAGKTNLLEAVYFGCTGRSCRTANEREVVRFGAPGARVVIAAVAEGVRHDLAVGFVPGEPKRMQADGAPVERLLDVDDRPLVSVFLPDRLELIKGAPALRRAHIDQLTGALWPARIATRRTYAQTLAQRNALIARVRAGAASPESLTAWDQQLAQHGIALMRDRADATARLAEPFSRLALALGLERSSMVEYRPRSRARAPDELEAELTARRESDIERGFTGHGPHRDELAVSHDARELRTYGSQGQQRLALLALLLAEREVIAELRGRPPLMLLDDVMSELDGERREALVELLRSGPGQSLITTTDLEHVPGTSDPDVGRIQVSAGAVTHEPVAA